MTSRSPWPRPMTLFVGVCCLAFVVSACVSSFFKPASAKSERYRVQAPPAPWRAADGGGSDLAYRAEDGEAAISVNSVCGQNQDLGLEDLTKQLMVGFQDARVLGQRPVTVDGLAGLESQVKGQLDAKDFVGLYTVLRSRQCVYDLLLVASPDALSRHEDAYRRLVASFRENGGDAS